MGFSTIENNIIHALKSVKARQKHLTIEEGPLTYWASQIAHSVVNQVITCDPRENALIYKSPHKKDKVDTRKLCRLLRLDELKHIYRPDNDERAIFKSAAQHYIGLRNQLMRLKQKIKALYRHWELIDIFTDSVYSSNSRDKYLMRVEHIPIRNQLLRLYHLMDQAEAMLKSALRAIKKTWA